MRDELAAVERLLQDELSPREPWMKELAGGFAGLGGKRIRPLLTLLWGAASGGVREAHIEFAAACELIHLATLVHDDVLDDAQVRRNRQAMHRQHGTRAAILGGDWLFTSAFRVAARNCPGPAIAELAAAAREVCSGEVHQNWLAGDLSLEHGEYVEMVSAKTASLCAVACRMGPYLIGVGPEAIDTAGRFGRHLGVAFQVTDDCLDLVGDEGQVGKTLGTDIAAGKLTSPLIHLLVEAGPTVAAQVKSLLRANPPDAASIQRLVLREGGIDSASRFATAELERAAAAARKLAPSPARDALIQLTSFVACRQN